jgi:hypothetical protein
MHGKSSTRRCTRPFLYLRLNSEGRPNAASIIQIKSHPTGTKKHGYWLLFIAFLLLVFLHILSWVISQYRVAVTFDVHASPHIHTQGCEPSRAEEDEKPSH